MKIVTLNLANYDDVGNWDERVQQLAEELIALDPDLVALQEVRFNPDDPSTQTSYQNMAEQVLATIRGTDGGEAWAYTALVTQPAMYYPVVNQDENPWQYPEPCSGEDDVQEWEGLSMLLRKGALETGSRFLSKDAGCTDGNRRITQYAAAEGLDIDLYLFNAHFALGDECISENVTETLAYMDGFEGHRLLVGDLNATPDDSVLEPLSDAGLVDLWSLLEGDDPGYTYPSDAPTKRIDYCWASEGLASMATGIELIATQPDADGIYISDHLGLCLTLDTGTG